MKKKGLLAVLLAITIVVGNFSSVSATENISEESIFLEETAGTEEVIGTEEATETEEIVIQVSEESITAANLYGAWEGTYQGTDSNGTAKRTIRLDIDNCEASGVLEGIAKINGGADGSYFFSGNIDFTTGKITFQGTDWIENPNNFSFPEFEGTLKNSTISGTLDGDDSKTFSVTKTSESYQSKRIAINEVPKDWTGEYDGLNSGKVVRRNYEVHITQVKSDGTIKGTAIISPSDKADAADGANGSYLFGGTIDERRGKISIQGYEWTDYPIGYTNFGFVSLEGFLDLSSGKISGTSENGIWEMQVINYDNVNVISGFTLGRDNNSYVHTNSADWDGAGFIGTTNYCLNKEYYEKLTKNATKSDKNRIQKEMKSEWGGSCYGIAATMGLLYEGHISLKDLSEREAANYYALPYPCEDEKFLNTINYYYLSQYLTNGGKTSAAVSTAYNYGIFTGLANWACEADSLSVFLKKLVTYTSSNHVEMLLFSTKEGGHAVLITGCEYDKENEQYKVTIYDENSVRSSSSNGKLAYMTVAKDFSSFSYIDSNGDTITEKTFRQLCFLDWNKMSNVTSEVSTSSNTNYVYLEVPFDQPFKATNSRGKYISYDGTSFSGTMPVYTISTVDNDGESRLVIGTSSTNAITLSNLGQETDIEVRNKDTFMAVDGSKVESATMSFKDGITLNGPDYSFDAYISTKQEVAENENGMISVSADAGSKVHISTTGSKVNVDADSQMKNVKATSYIGAETKERQYDGALEELEVDINKFDEKKSTTLKFAFAKVTKTYGNKAFTNKLTADTDGKITYSSSNKKVAIVNSAGKVTIKGIGIAKITATAAEGTNYQAGSVSYTLKVNPKGTSIASVKAGSKGFTVKLKKQTKKTTGYQIQYSASKKFKNAKTVKITKNKTISKKISKLKGKKKYYVRVRTYTKVSGKYFYSSWSKAKSVTTKK